MDRQNWLERAKELILLKHLSPAQYMEAISLQNIGHQWAWGVADDWDARENLNHREVWFIQEALREIGGRLLMQQNILPGSAGWDLVWD